MSVSRQGQVYLVRADNNLYKIGRTSKGLEARFAALQLGCACALELLWWITTEDSHALETALHRRFAVVQHHGEWFVLSEGDVRFIEAISSPVVRLLLLARELDSQQERDLLAQEIQIYMRRSKGNDR